MSLCSVAAVLLCEDDGGGATAKIVCAGHPLPLLVRDGAVRPVGSFSPMLGAYASRSGSARRSRSSPATCSCSSPTASSTPSATASASARSGWRARSQGVTDAADAVARIDAALSAFEVGEQADDTAVLAVQRVRGRGDRQPSRADRA